MVQKTNIFTTAVLEDGLQVDAWFWHQSVRTAIRDRDNLTAEIDDSGAGYSARGIQDTSDRGLGQVASSAWWDIWKCLRNSNSDMKRCYWCMGWKLLTDTELWHRTKWWQNRKLHSVRHMNQIYLLAVAPADLSGATRSDSEDCWSITGYREVFWFTFSRFW